MNGKLELYGFDIEWWASCDEDDGFDWRVEVNGASLEDIAVLMEDHYDAVEAAVRKAFEREAADEAVENMIDQAERAAMFAQAGVVLGRKG